MKETIIAAAVRIPVAKHLLQFEPSYPEFLIISSPPPARHYSLIHPLAEHYKRMISPDNQGFLTSTGRFVGREEGLNIALTSGQPMIDHPSRNSKYLFSEDLW